MDATGLPHCFDYDQCDIPEGLTIAQWRTAQAAPQPRRRRWRRLLRRAWRSR